MPLYPLLHVAVIIIINYTCSYQTPFSVEYPASIVHSYSSLCVCVHVYVLVGWTEEQGAECLYREEGTEHTQPVGERWHGPSCPISHWTGRLAHTHIYTTLYVQCHVHMHSHLLPCNYMHTMYKLLSSYGSSVPFDPISYIFEEAEGL